MKMPKKAGVLFTIVGVVLIVLALLLFLFNCYEDYSAGQKAESLMEEMRSAMEKTKISAADEETAAAELPVVEIDGYGYVGYLFIPALGLELPVMAEWDYTRLEIAPCRQFGSSRTDDLVIAAHNFKTHFGRLSALETGAEVFFTDMDGIENQYTVKNINTLDPDAVDAVQNSGYDLVLYTCTTAGTTRVVVFCDRKDTISRCANITNIFPQQFG